MTDQHTSRIAVIGAGIAGLTCASKLAEAGMLVDVFEKSRGIGGRIATRRTEEGVHFDHGAQYFTAATPAFQDFTAKQLHAGTLERWRPEGRPETARSDWLVGRPTMNAFLKPLDSGFAVALGIQVEAILPAPGGWSLRIAGSDTATDYNGVVVTAPSPQAKILTRASEKLQARLDGVDVAPCWALMLSARQTGQSDRSILENPHPDIAWMARNTSKPGRNTQPETWVIHASAEYSTHHLEAEPGAVAAHLQQIALPLIGLPQSAVIQVMGHRWRYARTIRAAGTPFLSDETGTLLAAGDWCLGARVESAFESGRAAAEFLAGKLDRRD
ncbi:MAG: NAD(P)/FAD-dependent oxidoreductase [Hyphomonas sp.]